MAKEIVMTAKGYEELKTQLYELKTVKRSQIADKIKTARGFGDLSENSEYDEAKNEQAIVEANIQLLEEKLKNVKLVDSDTLSTEVISIGSRVRILDIEGGDEMEYHIVSALEASGEMNVITDKSPVGEALIGHRVGDTVKVEAPAGSFEIKVIDIGI